MKTTTLMASACVAALFSCPNLARADDSATRYYSGSFTCSGQSYATDWNISKGLSGEISATVYYQRTDSSQVQWIDLTERSSPGGPQLHDANGNPRIAVVVDGQTINAAWRAGPPASDCSPFAISRTENPKSRFDAIFKLMETPEPSDDIASQVAKATQFPPIAFALPELDRQAYHQRYLELTDTFWGRYQDTMVEGLGNQSLASEEDRKVFAERLDAALSNAPRFMSRRDGLQAMIDMMQQASDRYATNGGTPAETLYAGKGSTCQRMQTILKADPYFNFSKLELATGLSSDYWTRTLAEDLLSGLRACKDVIGDYADQLTRKWPEIQKRQELVRVLQQEQARLVALPVTMETLVETRNLQPNAQVRQSVSPRSTDYKRFFGKPLDSKRQALLEVSLTSITEQSKSYDIDKPQAAKAVSDACGLLNDVSDLDAGMRDTIRQTCSTANESISSKQAEQSVSRIEAAYANIEPDSGAQKAADELCEKLPSTITNRGVASKVYEACSSAKQAMETKKDVLKCEQAVSASGASSTLLESKVPVLGAVGISSATLKDLVCGASKMNAQLSFSSTGFLAWKTQLMDMRLERPKKGEELLRFVLTPANNGTDWVVGVEDENTNAILAKQKMKAEIVTACIMRTAACHR